MTNSAILTGTARPGTPDSWSHTDIKIKTAREWGFFPPETATTTGIGNHGYEVTWHHNIPWKTLRDSWTVVFVFCDWAVVEGLLRIYGSGNMPGVANTLKAMKEAIGPTPTNAASSTYEKWVARFSAGTENHLIHLSAEKQLSKQNADLLAENIAWQGWNIVEGPKESVRVLGDDPGSDGFDDFSLADPDRVDRYKAVSDLYSALIDIERDYNAKKGTVADWSYMRDVWSVKMSGVVRAGQFLAGRGGNIVVFNKKMWRPVRQGGAMLTVDLTGKTYYQMRKKNAQD